MAHFQSRDHQLLASASLIPVDDPTTLFISAGMQPLQPFYQGLKRPPAPRLTSAQKCMRVGDLEQVGRTDRHQTFFEMLGNFAPTGDYFKETAIALAWEFVTDPERGLGLPPDRLRVTIHPSDEDARRLWQQEAGLSAGAVHEDSGNWWGLEFGPCGPDSELWWDRGPQYGCGEPDCGPDHCDRFLEFWNLVFPQFDRRPDGELAPLPRPAVDTGLGLERVAAILQGVPDSYSTDLFRPLVEFVQANSSQPLALSERIIADHLRAASFAIADGVLPANEGRGYVLRRLIRRATLHAHRCGLRVPLAAGVAVVVETMRDQYPYLLQRASLIETALGAEADRFNRTLERGMEIFAQVAAHNPKVIPGADAFRLHDTFGFPLALTRELAQERGQSVDEEGFEAAMEAQRGRSRGQVKHSWSNLRGLPSSEFVGYEELEATASVRLLRVQGAEVEVATEGDEVEVYLDRTPFYAESGGQVGDQGTLRGPNGEVQVDDTQRPLEGVIAHLGRVRIGRLKRGDQVIAAVQPQRRRQIMRHHSATHLLNRALEEVTGEGELQRGSFVGPTRTTFDFAFDRALSGTELTRIRRILNAQVRGALPRQVQILPYTEAVSTGATHLFEERYGDQVRVVSFGDFSREFCGGTHVANSAEVGPVLLLSEGSVGAGVRRIELVAGEAAEELMEKRLGAETTLAQELGVPVERLAERVTELRAQLRADERRIEQLQEEVRRSRLSSADGVQRRAARVPLILEQVVSEGGDDLRAWADRYLESLGGSGVVAVANSTNFVIKVSRDLTPGLNAQLLAPALGRGGGRPELAQGRLGRDLVEGFEELQKMLA